MNLLTFYCRNTGTQYIESDIPFLVLWYIWTEVLLQKVKNTWLHRNARVGCYVRQKPLLLYFPTAKAVS